MSVRLHLQQLTVTVAEKTCPIGSGVTAGGGTTPGDTLQGGDTQTKKTVAEFTKNSG